MARLTTRAEREGIRSIKRICNAGLNSLALREEVGRRAAEVLPAAAYALMCTDPHTGLFTHGSIEGVPERFLHTFLHEFYPDQIIETTELARNGGGVAMIDSDAYLSALRLDGLAHTAHVVLTADGDLWGTWCLFRETGSGGFTEKDLAFMRAAAPHVAQGMRAAAAIDAAASDAEAHGTEVPGVIAVDGRGRVTLRSGGAAAHLEDLADVGFPQGRLPYAVTSVLAKLRAAPLLRADSSAAAGELRAQGRSGRWYRLRATQAEPGAAGDQLRVVVIEPAAWSAPPAIAARYRLTQRERDVLVLVARGYSNKRIAAQLELSVHTVREHVGNACTKVGARGRRQLLAALFRDNTAEMRIPA